GGENDSVTAITKALLSDEDLEKHGRRTGDEFAECGALMGVSVPLRHQGRVALQLQGRNFNRVPRVLQDVLAQVTQAAMQGVTLVDQFVVVPELRTVEELRLAIIRIPSTVPHPMTKEMALARDVIGVESRRGEFATNLDGQLRSATFVGVEAEHPIVS